MRTTVALIVMALNSALGCQGGSGGSGDSGDGRFDLVCTADDNACTEVCVFEGQALDAFGENVVDIDQIEVREGSEGHFRCPREFCNWSFSARIDSCDLNILKDFNSHLDVDSEGGEVVHD